MNPSLSSPSATNSASLLQRFCGLALLVLGLVLLWAYPVGSHWLLLLAFVLAGAQWRYQHSWLLALPLLLACVDLGAWSGWLMIDEFDGLLAVLAGTALATGQYAHSGASLRRDIFWLWMLALVLALGLQRGLFPLSPLDANAWYGYLTNWNAVRVARGGLWALVFTPLLLRQSNDDRSAVENLMALGFTLAMVGFGVYVLWQRGLLIDLMTAKDHWGLFSNWLNMAGKYRITGTFSQMHLGGEAVDAFLILVWPFAFWLLLQTKRLLIAAIAALALALAAYAVMVTFTRTTYLAAGLAFLVYLMALYSSASRSSRSMLLFSAAFLLVCSALTWSGFRYGGTLLLISYVGVLAGCLTAGLFREHLPNKFALIGVALILIAGLAIALRAMLTSHWADTGWGAAIAIAVPSILILGLGGLGVGRSLNGRFSLRNALVFLTISTVLMPISVIALSGYQMQTRVNAVGADLETRMTHWQKVVSLVPDNLAAQLFGRGLGSFPRANLLEGSSDEVGWFFVPHESKQVLRLVGNSSLVIGQRLVSPIPGQYKFSAQVRNPSRASATLEVRLQPRRVLEMGDWEASTKEFQISVKPGKVFERVERIIDIEPAAIPRWFDPKYLVFSLTNQGHHGSALDLADIQLNDPNGQNILINGDFTAGGKRWLAYSDFSHLDWHMKSIYVATYFESGFFGLTVLLALVLVVVARCFRQIGEGRTFGAPLLAAIAGFLVLGLTGTLNDVPRVMTLFLLLCAAALWRKRHD